MHTHFLYYSGRVWANCGGVVMAPARHHSWLHNGGRCTVRSGVRASNTRLCGLLVHPRVRLCQVHFWPRLSSFLSRVVIIRGLNHGVGGRPVCVWSNRGKSASGNKPQGGSDPCLGHPCMTVIPGNTRRQSRQGTPGLVETLLSPPPLRLVFM